MSTYEVCVKDEGFFPFVYALAMDTFTRDLKRDGKEFHVHEYNG